MNAFLLIGVIVAALAAGSCGSMAAPAAPSTSTPAPAAPQPAALNLSGAWSGGATDSQGPASVSWTLAQSGANVTGTVRTNALNPDDGSCSSCHRNKSGTVTGTLSVTANTTALTLTMSFAAGVDGDPTPACSATLTATSSSLSSSNVVADYSGSDTCEGTFANGTLTMHR
jgi:hypothetical protein